ncbi:MAG: hypothetical protein QOF26_4279, partial [Baekduia sp.]|nr:hypothetical protein [Baekduia sp.]
DPAPPDGGEPQGANDDRPAMLGRRFRETLVTGMLIGLVLALGAHGVLVYTWYSANTISWFIVGIGGMVVGGALSLFLYGAATDRTDTGPKPHGQADVSERGEWSRTVARRRAPLRRR